MEGIYAFFLVLSSVLGIILFFRIWGETNNIAKMRRIMERMEKGETEKNTENATAPSSDVKSIENKKKEFYVGMKVRRISDGKILTVKKVDDYGAIWVDSGITENNVYSPEDLEPMPQKS